LFIVIINIHKGFALTYIPFPVVVAHLRRNAGLSLDPVWCSKPWYYLSGFYSQTPGSGSATRALQTAIESIGKPIILCCEPILGTDPRSLTAKTENLDPETRFTGLCNYYRSRFGLGCEARTHCTLKTEIMGCGRRWSEPDRTFMWSLPLLESLVSQEPRQPHHYHSEILSRATTLDRTREQHGRQQLLQ